MNLYEENKLKHIKYCAEKYSVKKFQQYNYESRISPKDMYLDLLKETLIKDRITMLGKHKINTIRFCIEECLENNISGDIIETGVWRGGATIYMAGVLKANGDNDKKVFVADSFEGLPRPDVKKYPKDNGDKHYTRRDLAVDLDAVKNNFKSFNLLDSNVIFVKGFFEESLKHANIGKLSILRLDGDMYGSTITVLKQLYHKLEVGGYIIIDDWLLAGAQNALLNFRDKMDLAEELYEDYSGVFWKKVAKTDPPSW